MPTWCKKCGSHSHSTTKCPRTPEYLLANELKKLALEWVSTELNGDDPAIQGRQRGINQCGEDLFSKINPILKGMDSELHSK